jgi:hypothetical protein
MFGFSGRLAFWRGTVVLGIVCAGTILAQDTAPAVTGQFVKKQVLVAVQYVPEGLFGTSMPDSARPQAELAARQAAVAMYRGDCPVSRRVLLEKMAANIDADISRIVPQLEILSERIDKEHKTLELSATATVDVGLIEAIIKSGMAATATAATSTKERVPMVFIFMSRKIVGITTSDGKKVSFQKNAKQNSESEKTTAGGKGVDVDYNMEDVTIKEYGGKSIDKAQVVEWTADTVSSVDTAINEIFTQAGYETTDAVDVEGLNVKKFREDYGVGDDVKPETRQEANKLLRSQEVGYFATGHMDVCLPSKHEVSGLPQVFVKVEAKITDLRGKLPKTVAAVAGEYYQGCGENVQVATQNALLAAARQAAAKLVDQLRAKSL